MFVFHSNMGRNIISKAAYDAHVTKKDEARQEESQDKDSAHEEKSMCPKTQSRTDR